jgi:hypothetical protein
MRVLAESFTAALLFAASIIAVSSKTMELSRKHRIPKGADDETSRSQ